MTSDDSATLSVLDRAARGYRATFHSQAVRVGCKAAAVLVLARLVSPVDHGLFAMASSVFFVLVSFRDLGLGAAAVQARELSEEQSTTLWRAHIVIGLAFALVAAALAPAAAAFYREPRVAPLLALLAIGLALLAFNAWPRVLLGRELRFKELNQIETRAAVVATAVMIAAGALGAGAYTFPVFFLVSEGLVLVDAWRVCRWRPRAPARWESLRQFGRTATGVTGYNALLTFLQQVDGSLMGRWFGAPALGLYNRPAQLLALPAQHIGGPMTQVLLATLSRLGPASPEFAKHVRETANLIAHATLPLAVACATMPEEIVRLLLGRNWPDAAPLLRWLALGAGASYLTVTLPSVCIATGHTRRLAATTGWLLAATLAGVWLGRGRGPAGLAAGAAIAQGLSLLPRVWWTTRGTAVRPADFAGAFFRPLLFAGVSAIGIVAGRAVVGDAAWAIRLGGGLFGGVLAGAALAGASPGLRSELRRVWWHRPWIRQDAGP